jgi:hypothetical protein
MDNLIESIRVAVLAEASDEHKQKGALACRTILTALEAKPGEALAAPPPAAPVALPDLAPLIQAVRTMGPDQLLDVAIARLRAALPAGASVAHVGAPQFHIVPVAPLRGAS